MADATGARSAGAPRLGSPPGHPADVQPREASSRGGDPADGAGEWRRRRAVQPGRRRPPERQVRRTRKRPPHHQQDVRSPLRRTLDARGRGEVRRLLPAAGLSSHERRGGLGGRASRGHCADHRRAQYRAAAGVARLGEDRDDRIAACRDRGAFAHAAACNRPHGRAKKVKLLAFALLAALALPAAAQSEFPSKPLRILVPTTAGGVPDVLARAVGQRIADSLGQPVVIENRAGAGGILAAEAVLKSPADGHTLFLGDTGNYTVSAALYANFPYDVQKDFVPVVLAAAPPVYLVANPASPIGSVQDLVRLAKAGPPPIYGSTGNGNV